MGTSARPSHLQLPLPAHLPLQLLEELQAWQCWQLAAAAAGRQGCIAAATAAGATAAAAVAQVCRVVLACWHRGTQEACGNSMQGGWAAGSQASNNSTVSQAPACDAFIATVRHTDRHLQTTPRLLLRVWGVHLCVGPKNTRAYTQPVVCQLAPCPPVKLGRQVGCWCFCGRRCRQRCTPPDCSSNVVIGYAQAQVCIQGPEGRSVSGRDGGKHDGGAAVEA